ncbi:MAG: alpha/beta hydrolase [Elusimicrobiota bacterium]|jgi:hypothetical protein
MIKILILCVLVGVLGWGLLSMERRSLYFPDRRLVATPAVYRLAYEDLHLTASDGVRIHGWFIPASKAPSSRINAPLAILLCHGNAGNVSHRLDKLSRLHLLGVNVLLFDYRGYGLSEGKPSEKGTYLDAEAAYRYLTDVRKIPPDQIVLYGESLGCAVATEMAMRHPSASGLILESPFTSTVAMANIVLPWFPASWIIRNRYDSLSKIPRLNMPLLILHSPHDEIVPFHMGQALYAAAP